MIKKYILLFIITCISCNTYNRNKKEQIQENSILEGLKMIPFNDLKKVGYRNIEVEGKLFDSIFISKNLCKGVDNECFSSEDRYRKRFYGRFQSKFSNDISFLFYIVSDSKLSNKTYMSSVKGNKIVSNLIIDKFDHFDCNNVINFSISSKNEFKIDKFFTENERKISIKEVYKIDTVSGKFYLTSPPEF